MTEEPLDQYLWDGSGEPDEQLARLEQLLARYRHTAPLGVAIVDAAPETDTEPPG